MAAGGLFNPQDLDELVVSLTKPGALADKHAGGRIVSCLEGGYNLGALARSVAAHLRVLMQ